MNSEERHAARRARREAERARKREERLCDCTLENVADLGNLYRAAVKSGNGVSWKASVQRYRMRTLRNILKARRDLLAGNDIRRGFNRFQLFERGKLRDICSVHFSERVIQKSLSANALVPALTPTFIRNNTANTKGRGTGDALDRLKKDLVKHYRKHGREGYILLIDFSSYFANIAHEPLKEIVRNALDDPRIVKLTYDLIDACGENGRIIVKPCRDSITRERRKLKKMRRMVDGGRLTLEQVKRSYQSWRGSMLKLDAHRTVLNMDALYKSLFGDLIDNNSGGG